MSTAGILPVLPIELWKMIAFELGSPYRNTLRSLALVSHTFFDIAVPLIYEFIVINDHIGDKVARMHRLENSTYLLPDRVHFLRRTFDGNTHLADYVHALAEVEPEYEEADSDEEEDIRGYRPTSTPNLPAILTHLRNVQRLNIVSLDNEDLHLIPSSAPLTHVCLPVSHDWKHYLKSFLEKHHNSIRFLGLASPLEDLQTVLPASLARLESFVALYPMCWDTLAETAPLKHLSAMRFSAEWVHHPDRVFTNIITLRITLDIPAKPISEIGKSLKNLQSLYITDPYLEIEDSQVEDLMNISSPSITYIYIGKANFGFIWDERTASSSAKLLFHRYPSLGTIDFCVPRHKYSFFFKLAYRYYRDSQSAHSVHLPLEKLPLWWRDDFGPYLID